MFSRNRIKLASVAVSAIIFGAHTCWATPDALTSVNTANLPINAASQTNPTDASKKEVAPNALVSPSKAKSNVDATKSNNTAPAAGAPVAQAANAKQVNSQPQAPVNAMAGKDDYSFDLKMKAVNTPAQQKATSEETATAEKGAAVSDADLPKDIQYKANPVESLGNSVLSQLDSDLFTQMSEIEKSMTLLTLELRREKIRNEIEAQKAIRQKNQDDLERKKAEDRLKELEKQKKIEALVIQEKQALMDKEKIFEILKQRKLLNAYMNQMLVNQQEWLKEKEALYAQIEAVELEKKELVDMFKQRIDKVLDASAKNIQVAEAARANFERIVKSLKARNEQLRKRVEADAQIIKNAKNNMYLNSQSLEELKDKNANAAVAQASKNNVVSAESPVILSDGSTDENYTALSAKYAILGISGVANNMLAEIIDVDGQPMSVKVGSALPTGHVVSEITSNFIKFNSDSGNDFLYVGRSIDGFVPTLGLLDDKEKN